MAKRMTDTEKWKKPFFKTLPAEYKCFWLYLLDDCDHCGIWHVDLEVAQLRLGIKLSLEKALGLFKERVVVFDDKTKWFILDFIPFQYGVLTDKSKMAKPIIPILQKYNLIPYLYPINRVKEKEQDKDTIGNTVLSNNTGGENQFLLAEISKLKEAYLAPQNKIVFDQVCMTYYLLPGDGVSWVDEFCRKLIREGEIVKTFTEFQRHFANWMKFQDVKKVPVAPKAHVVTEKDSW